MSSGGRTEVWIVEMTVAAACALVERGADVRRRESLVVWALVRDAVSQRRKSGVMEEVCEFGACVSGAGVIELAGSGEKLESED